MNTEPLTTLKGIGEKTEKLFAKECGIRKNCPQSVGKRKPEKERRCPGTLRGAGAAAAYLV